MSAPVGGRTTSVKRSRARSAPAEAPTTEEPIPVQRRARKAPVRPPEAVFSPPPEPELELDEPEPVPPEATGAAPHPPDRDTAIELMPAQFLQCRDFGHSWRPFKVTQPGPYFEQTLRCARCKTQRTRLLSLTGARVSSSYDYADGYQMKGYGPMTGGDRDHIRLASIMRLLPKKARADE
jgi:hypothetical protein